MIVTRHHLTLEMEVVKWLLLIAFAIIAALAMATALAAAEPMIDPMDAPARLPADVEMLATPMDAVPARPFFPEEGPVYDLPPAALAARVWMILETQRAGLAREALAGWREIYLPGQAEAWREVAMAAANLTAGKLDRAAMHLDNAREYDNAQAIVAYYTGILRLEQAAAAARVPDEATEGTMRLVAYDPLQGTVGQTVLRVLARRQLEMAIVRAGEIRLDERLVMGEPGIEEEFVVPRVGDLLVALEANNFVGKAHHLLFGIEMDRGQLRQAEEHLDQAVATGIAPLFGYGDLTEGYLALEQRADALRVTQKDMAANYPLLWEAGQEMKAALEQVWESWVW
jgi:tetratricopeptide (TPR) repeat protein